MNPRADVLLWAQRIVGRKGAAPHQLLEIDGNATEAEAQAAFHKAARMAHPDLHRTTLTTEELELVTTAYARLAGAYQEFRTQGMTTMRLQPLKDLAASLRASPVPVAGLAPPRGIAPGVAPVAEPSHQGVNVTREVRPAAASASAAMTSKALLYYRKAELSLRRGDLRGAVLQLKLAIATDPHSALLRTALTEVETEMAKAK